MACGTLLSGLDLTCLTERHRRYYQNVVLVNREDVDFSNITSSNTENHIVFTLKPGTHGYLFHTPDLGFSISAEFTKSEENGIPLYNHEVSFPVIGVKENIKALLKQLDSGDFFGAVQYRDGTIEIYGFNYGLRNSPYTYEPQSEMGGANLSLESVYQEYDPPYTYAGDPGDFDDLFENIDLQILGEFNDDFNNDFNITT